MSQLSPHLVNMMPGATLEESKSKAIVSDRLQWIHPLETRRRMISRTGQAFTPP